MKFDYLRVEEEQRNLRGQLDVIRQLRQPPDRSHYFHTRHDVYSLDSPENRLINGSKTWRLRPFATAQGRLRAVWTGWRVNTPTSLRRTRCGN